mmetsp:Transcript_118067/g.306578  ORF Transcript_118067/g.306578 Transcript_118067/m.306578 type:complete len:226 (-) Transcript_118067:1132-1809(-)
MISSPTRHPSSAAFGTSKPVTTRFSIRSLTPSFPSNKDGTVMTTCSSWAMSVVLLLDTAALAPGTTIFLLRPSSLSTAAGQKEGGCDEDPAGVDIVDPRTVAAPPPAARRTWTLCPDDPSCRSISAFASLAIDVITDGDPDCDPLPAKLLDRALACEGRGTSKVPFSPCGCKVPLSLAFLAILEEDLLTCGPSSSCFFAGDAGRAGWPPKPRPAARPLQKPSFSS